MELLKVENLCKIYGKGENEVKAVDGVSFSVERGQMVAIIGASGSGKSTLLHMIGAVDRPTVTESLIARRVWTARMSFSRITESLQSSADGRSG